jgi:hypothetical protein
MPEGNNSESESNCAPPKPSIDDADLESVRARLTLRLWIWSFLSIHVAEPVRDWVSPLLFVTLFAVEFSPPRLEAVEGDREYLRKAVIDGLITRSIRRLSELEVEGVE